MKEILVKDLIEELLALPESDECFHHVSKLSEEGYPLHILMYVLRYSRRDLEFAFRGVISLSVIDKERGTVDITADRGLYVSSWVVAKISGRNM